MTESQLMTAERRFKLTLREALRAVVGPKDPRTVARQAGLSAEIVSATLDSDRAAVTPTAYARICAAMGVAPEQALLRGTARVEKMLGPQPTSATRRNTSSTIGS